MWASLLAIAYKEILHVFRDRGTYVTMLVLQAFQLGMCGYLDLTVKNLPVAVVDQDQSSQSRELIAKIDATRTLRVKLLSGNPDDARALIRASSVRMAVVIPPDYHDKLLQGSGASVLAMVDGSDAATADQAISAFTSLGTSINVSELSGTNGAIAADAQPFTMNSLIMFNPQGRAAFFLLPGLVAFLLVSFLVSSSSESLLNEINAGTMERLLMTPLDAGGLIVGKIAPYAVLGFGNFLLLMLALRWGFGVPIRGNLALLIVAGALYTVTLLGVGVFVACKGGSIAEAHQKNALHYLASVFMSGYIFPLTSLPKVLLPIAYALPATHMVAITRGLAIRGASFTDLVPHFAYFLVAPVILIVFAVVRFRATIQR